ncbi:phage baseplate plug family protein [Serratia aquatilis]|uniref:Phage baseplate plug protein n=1 Tax=Serratia aquatilis TaxID=1737515 RepID=A0ABV6EEH7_9GAMM
MNLTHSADRITPQVYKIIPLNSGAAVQRFRVQLGDRLLIFRLRWLTRYGYFCADIFEGEIPITLGRALHPGVDLLAGLNTTIGRLVLEGESPNVDTLGASNRLIWYSSNEQVI